METQHTPGPWRTRKRFEDCARVIVASDFEDNGPICELAGLRRSREEAANQALISAAPELLEVCEMVLDPKTDPMVLQAAAYAAVDKARRKGA